MKCQSIVTNETEWLFYFLWLKEVGKPIIKYNFKIPNTVIYKVGRPYEWYFTAQDGTIRMRAKGKLYGKIIKEEFLKSKTKRPIAASAYSYEATRTRVTMT